jgi:hypothetical protein
VFARRSSSPAGLELFLELEEGSTFLAPGGLDGGVFNNLFAN